MGRRSRVLFVVLALAVVTAAAVPAVAEAPAGATQVQAAQEALDRVRAIRAGEASGDLTLALRDLWAQRQLLDGAEFAQATDEFGRPIMPAQYDTPEGNFRIHYQSDAGSPDFATQDFVVQTGQVFEEVLADQTTRQGWLRPAGDGPRGGDGRIDVYLADLGAQGIFGFASPDDDATCDPSRCAGVHGWMGMDNDYAEFGVPPISALKATTAHEFHHLIQFAEAFLVDGWMFEATATWQESVVYPDDDARTFYIPAYSDAPELPLTTFDDNGHQYAMYVFMRYLADRFGDGVVLEAWRAALDADQHSLDGLGAALGVRGASFDRVFAEFTAAAAAWNVGGFPRDVVQGTTVAYPELARAGALVDGQTANPVLDHTSATLYSVGGVSDVGARITVDRDIRGAVAVVAAGPDGVRTSVAPLVGGTATASLPDVAGADVTVVVVNGDPAALPFEAPFQDREYLNDQVGFTVEVGSDIVGGGTGGGGLQDALVDGGRVAGTDPVAQAIATSQAVFADGAASRVVLATSERFPDALAGSGLARDLGPILFTPFAETLDPRVAAEIGRVTGGSGQVLVLGGVLAVSDGAAAAARTAAGDQPCASPLPASCRYAGGGREETAALIGETVQAEVGGTTALIARGDDFADAITGGAYAAEVGAPLLLTPSTSPNTSTAAFLQAHPELTDVVVLGGTAAVDDATAGALGADRRAAGDERTATSVAIADQLWDDDGIAGAVLVNVRAADGWPAALSAAVASAVFDAPQLGVETGSTLSPTVTQHLQSAVFGPVQAFGSTALVSDAQLQAALEARGAVG